MRVLGFAVGMAMGMGGVAWGQTEVDLSATGMAMVAPDEFVAGLQAQATSRDAAAAQLAVNRLMAQGLKLARMQAGMDATAGDFSVGEVTPDNGPESSAADTQYQASQTLNLMIATPDGVPAPAFLGLVGQLQKRGFLVESLGGDLSAGARAKAMSGAIGDAMVQIGTQADAVAGALHEVLEGYKSVTVGGNSPGPIRMNSMAMAAMAPVAAVAAPAPISVEADVQAVVALKTGG